MGASHPAGQAGRQQPHAESGAAAADAPARAPEDPSAVALRPSSRPFSHGLPPKS